ncbi:hypothetical protein L9W92_16040 [Pelotomaculum terephthalicicum JT]|nr:MULTISPECIES: hypothetical protein [Pelotomaculum]MCG9969516.1 hypothetical protein [Pelotomaculum terephthalicicum JT]
MFPPEENFTATGALRLGVGKMTRFGFGKKEFEQLAGRVQRVQRVSP